MAAAMWRRRILSSALALASFPLSVAGLYAFGAAFLDPSKSPWVGFAWFAVALGCLVLSVLTEDRRRR